jgi:hypothetical protein
MTNTADAYWQEEVIRTQFITPSSCRRGVLMDGWVRNVYGRLAGKLVAGRMILFVFRTTNIRSDSR